MANRKGRLTRQVKRETAEARFHEALKTHYIAEKPSRSSFVWQNYVDAVEPYKAFWLRRPEDWSMRLKTSRHDKILNNFVSFVFDKRPAPKALSRVWNMEAGTIAFSAPVDFRIWYVHAVQERSLYKTVAKGLLTAKEVHHFTASPFSALGESLWYAVAMAVEADGVASRAIAHSKIRMVPLVESHHLDWVRWLARQAKAEGHRLSYREIDDLTDYYLHKVADAEREMRQREANGQPPSKPFALKGRTIKTMQKGMTDWHYEMRRHKRIAGGSWPGMPIPDSTFEENTGVSRTGWWFRQIRTGDDLWDEGNKMHHCVALYKPQCMEGGRAIWALAVDEHRGMGWRRALTIEVVPSTGAIVQARGFANRPPTASEVSILNRWAAQNGLSVDRI